MSLLEERYIDAGGYRLRTVTEGRGPALLLLHGFTGSTETLATTATALRRDFCTIRVDLPGHGRSDAPQELEPYTMESCVESLLDLLDTLEIERSCVFGYSMGGRTALALCAAHPDRVCAVAALGASAGIEDEALRAERVGESNSRFARIVLFVPEGSETPPGYEEKLRDIAIRSEFFFAAGIENWGWKVGRREIFARNAAGKVEIILVRGALPESATGRDAPPRS